MCSSRLSVKESKGLRCSAAVAGPVIGVHEGRDVNSVDEPPRADSIEIHGEERG